MKKKGHTVIFTSLIIFGFTCTVFPSNRTVSYSNTKIAGMGDTKIAGGFNYNGFNNNPALLKRVKYIRFSLLRIPLSINNHLLDVTNFIYYNKYNFENFNNLKAEGKEIFLNAFKDYEGEWGYINLSPMFDFAFSYRNHGFGIARYNISEFGIKTGIANNEPYVWGKGFARNVYIVGYARPVSFLLPGLTVGINLRYIERRRINSFQIQTSDLGRLNEISKTISEEFKVKNKTIAFDIGTLCYIPSIKSEIGATFQSIGDGRGASFDVGIAKQLLWNKLILLGDYRDILDNNRENIFKKFHFGTELNYDVFALRTGINSGYYTLGFGMNFKLIHFDFALFSDETSVASDVYKDKRMEGQIKLGW
ncbi:hypothetical protein ACFL6H_03590 [Candidatus Latescibacterota bacterium]